MTRRNAIFSICSMRRRILCTTYGIGILPRKGGFYGLNVSITSFYVNGLYDPVASVGTGDTYCRSLTKGVSMQHAENRDALVASPETKKIILSQIATDEKYCFRVKVDAQTVAEYAELYEQYLDDSTKENSATFPLGAITVLREGDDKFIVVAGRLRFEAAKKANLAEMPCIVLTDAREAIRVGLESNRHGLALNSKDKAHCIKIAVVEFGGEMSNRGIANLIGCSSRYVDKVVKEGKLRAGTQLVRGGDGKMYKVESEKPEETKGDTADTGLEPEKAFAKVLSALKLSDADDQQRVQSFVDVVRSSASFFICVFVFAVSLGLFDRFCLIAWVSCDTFLLRTMH